MSFHSLSVLVVLAAGLVYYFAVHRSIEEVILKTQFGTLKGFKAQSRDGREYNAFRTIPYAKPPIGELRFQPPVEKGKWEGVWDATVVPPLCLQADNVWRKIFGQEDCLYLNVFTPKLPKTSKDWKLLPVMLFIHGGYFMFGGTDLYDPSYFMDEDVVVVTLHYRLGAFGFLSTGDGVVSGNMGMKDQVMALQWVKSAIIDFGGDPNLVTIFGESAGGVSVHMHMFSPLSRGLFQRAISQSGSSLCPWANILYKDRRAQAIKLGKTLNCPTKSTTDLVKCLKSKDAQEIIKTHEFLYTQMFYNPEDLYSPTAEVGGDTSKAFLTTDTRTLYKEENVAKVPWMSGGNSEEGCYRTVPLYSHDNGIEKLHKNWNALTPNLLIYPKNPQASEKIKKFYLGKNPKSFTMEHYKSLTDMFSDRFFLVCLGESARFHVNHAPTYLYYVTHRNPQSLALVASCPGKLPILLELGISKLKLLLYTKVFGWEVFDYGVCHADELQYLFSTFPTTGISKSSPNYEFSKSFVKAWVSFAKNGYPGSFNGVEWTKAEPNKPPRYMHLGEPAGMIDEPFTARLKFWESLKLTPK